MSCFWEWALIKAILGHICCLSLLINFAFMVEYSPISTVLMHAMTMGTAKSYNCVSLWLSPGWRQNSWSMYRCFANRYRRVDFTLYTMYTGTCKTSLRLYAAVLNLLNFRCISCTAREMTLRTNCICFTTREMIFRNNCRCMEHSSVEALQPEVCQLQVISKVKPVCVC